MPKKGTVPASWKKYISTK